MAFFDAYGTYTQSALKLPANIIHQPIHCGPVLAIALNQARSITPS